MNIRTSPRRSLSENSRDWYELRVILNCRTVRFRLIQAIVRSRTNESIFHRISLRDCKFVCEGAPAVQMSPRSRRARMRTYFRRAAIRQLVTAYVPTAGRRFSSLSRLSEILIDAIHSATTSSTLRVRDNFRQTIPRSILYFLTIM